MLATRCPQCGRPTPVSLASADRIFCVACRYDGPPPPDVAHHLRAAAAMLGVLDVRSRQLSQAQVRAVTGSQARTFVYVLLFFCTAVAFGGCAACGAAFAGNAYMSHVFEAPFVILVISGIISALWITSKHRRMRIACAAVPPAAPGMPATCRICGAPIATQGLGAIARCGFCQGDNVVEAGVLDRVRGRQKITIDNFESHVRSAALGAAVAETLSILFVMAGSLLIPLFVAIGATVIDSVYSEHAVGADDTVDYAMLDVNGEQCMEKLTPDVNDSTKLSATVHGTPSTSDTRPPSEWKIIRASSAVGKRWRVHNCGTDGRKEDDVCTAVSAQKSLMVGNDIVFQCDGPDGGERRRLPIGHGCGTCLLIEGDAGRDR